MNHFGATFNKVRSKSYVFQTKAKLTCKCVKGAPSTSQNVHEEEFKMKWLQAIYNVKWNFTQKKIFRQN